MNKSIYASEIQRLNEAVATIKDVAVVLSDNLDGLLNEETADAVADITLLQLSAELIERTLPI